MLLPGFDSWRLRAYGPPRTSGKFGLVVFSLSVWGLCKVICSNDPVEMYMSTHVFLFILGLGTLIQV